MAYYIPLATYKKTKAKANKKALLKKQRAQFKKLKRAHNRENKLCNYCRLHLGPFVNKRPGYCSFDCQDKHIEQIADRMLA